MWNLQIAVLHLGDHAFPAHSRDCHFGSKDKTSIHMLNTQNVHALEQFSATFFKSRHTYETC